MYETNDDLDGFVAVFINSLTVVLNIIELWLDSMSWKVRSEVLASDHLYTFYILKNISRFEIF